MHVLGYVAPTTTVTLTFANAPDVTVTSVNGWIVLFSRDTAAWNGDKTWNEYVNGFGDPTATDFWLGLEYMHLISSSATYLLRVELQAAANGKYDVFLYSATSPLVFAAK